MINKKNIILLYLLIILEIIILFNSTIITNSVLNSSKIFIFNIFPSLFPTMILGNLLIKNNIIILIPNFIKKLFNKVFNFSDNLTSIFIMSFITGSPSNTMYVNEYLNKGLVTKEEAENIICCTHFINPLFIISSSIVIFNNYKIGLIIITLLLISNLIKAYILRNNFNNYSNNNTYITNNAFINTLKETIIECFKALLLILGIIILFNILLTLISHIFSLSKVLKTLLNGMLEMTTGILSISSLNIHNILKFIIMYYFISFGGLCIQLQSISMIENKKIKYLKYFIFRII